MKCEVREAMREKLEAAYIEESDDKSKSPAEARKAKQKISRLLMRIHDHVRKHGCLRD
jgi:hypothetical protein